MTIRRATTGTGISPCPARRSRGACRTGGCGMTLHPICGAGDGRQGGDPPSVRSRVGRSGADDDRHCGRVGTDPGGGIPPGTDGRSPGQGAQTLFEQLRDTGAGRCLCALQRAWLWARHRDVTVWGRKMASQGKTPFEILGFFYPGGARLPCFGEEWVHPADGLRLTCVVSQADGLLSEPRL